MKKLLNVLYWGIAGVLLMLMLVGACSCHSVKKISSSLKIDTDSTSKHTSEKTTTNVTETSNERNNNNWNASSSSTSGSDDIEITFDTSAYTGNFGRERTDSIPTFRKPGAIKIGRDKQGNLSIDPGGRNISKLKFKGETSSNQTNLQQSDSSSKLYAKQASEAKAKTLDSLALVKKLEAENHSKETKGFNWFEFFCWLIPILAAAYFTAKYLYKQKKLPLSLWLAKLLLFV